MDIKYASHNNNLMKMF